MITSFSPEVIQRLKHYVYRLVDPRNGRTFYVGEGCGNRVFAHVNANDLSFYNSADATEQDKRTEENDDPAKIRIIRDITSRGLSVIHIIQRWGMDQNTAYEVEASLIDLFDLDSLSNIVKGHDSERGMRYVDELEKELTATEFEEGKDTPKFILIKLNDRCLYANGGDNPYSIYKTVRGDWALDINNAKKYPYVLAVRRGIVIGVYKVFEDGWKKCNNSRRIYFDGEEAPEEIKKLFFGKKIPEKYRKRQNPATYCDSER